MFIVDLFKLGDVNIASARETLVKQFDHLRQNLLDLSMRNQLLNFRPGKRSVQAVDEISTEIYDLLVLQEKKMQFLQKPEAEDEFDNGKLEEDSNLTDEEAKILWELPSPDSNIADRHRDLFLQTNLSSSELQRRLRFIFQQAKSVFEEQGYNILYLALGFIEWKESPDALKLRKAPLILIPVVLTRKKVGSPFKLSWTGEDILTNISLKSKLEEQGIALPNFEMPEEKEGIYEYFQAVKTSVSKMNDWNVINDIYLSFFSFTKFVMYQDLDQKNWPETFSFEQNPILKDLFDPCDDYIEGFSEEDVDVKLRSEDIYNVLDADSSQIAVIEDVKAGRNLVVEGPPGTGKSQTIVNLIAELMASEKTILFVSEKMAALEVVKGRLDHIGLGEFCLELHSHKSNKKEVLNQLQKTLYEPFKSHSSAEDKFNELDDIKSDLNNYPQMIHEPVGKIKFSIFKLFGIKEAAILHFNKKNIEIPHVLMENIENCTLSEWNDSISKLENIKEILKSLKPLSQHPWRFSKPDIILPSDQNEIKDLLNQSIETIDDINHDLKVLSDISGVNIARNRIEMDEVIEYSQMIANSEMVEKDLLNNPEWDGPNENADLIIRTLKDLELKTENYDPQVLNEDLNQLINNFRKLSGKRLKLFSGDYKKAKKEIQSFYINDAPKNDEIIISDLEKLIACQEIRNNLDASEYHAKNYFGSRWIGNKSKPTELYEFSIWIKNFRSLLKEGKLSSNSIDILSNGPDKEKIYKIINTVLISYDNLLKTFENLQKFLKMDFVSLFNTDFSSVDFEDLFSQMEILRSEIPKLLLWSQFLSLKNELHELTLPLLELVEEDLLDPEDMIPCFKGNFADNQLKLVFRENILLSSFVGDLHENKINKFKELDQELLIFNRKRIAQKISEKKPSVHGKISPKSELGILLSEFNRKRRHMPIRKLLSVAGGLIQQIKPCFMMSPLSVAQFIDPKNMENFMFDVIIFDEASQVKPEDALGAFLRGKKLVVMGDTKQLPPTSFFDTMVDVENEEDDYELTSLEDMESILHLCKRSFPNKMLKWHYRSRHESLIAVSNHLFYDNQLLIYPSPINNSEKLGLKFLNQPESVYDRGRSSGNIIEAKAVVQEVVEHYKKYGNNKSLGVGTFNQNQRRLIEDYLEIELKQNPEIEEYFSENNFEKFFVKNLETIQGDERDVIFVSVGFGFDSNHKLYQNFGPINQDGGERRLNVLFTRAREKCIIFSNFKYSNLKIAENAPFGLRALKSFLEYAETHQLVAYEPPREDSDSPFEDSVYEFLTENGFEVHKQVGCAGFRIDLAVINQKSKGEYILGIECDGASYHSSQVARDRDRLRQQVLEGLGWKIHRIWSTDWFRNRDETSRKLLQAIENSKIRKESSELTFQEKIETVEKVEEKIEITPLEESNVENIPKVSLEDTIPEYEVCLSIGINNNCELHETSPYELAIAISRIVEIEGPVHFDEVIKRIRSYWGLKKSGKRIKNVIKSSALLAEQNGQIVIRNDFLYLKNEDELKVRRRTKNPSANIDLISPEEIENAIKLVIKSQFATHPDDLITQTARLLGFKSTRKKTAQKIQEVLNTLINRNELVKMTNGMINLTK